jgi:hypothetical protein
VSSRPARPRHSRKEIRDFADWLVKHGWVFESVDHAQHSIWSHPKSPRNFTLPETPKHFDVQRARREVLKLMGQKVEGKRNPKSQAKPPPRPTPPTRKAAPPARRTTPPDPVGLTPVKEQRSPYSTAQINATADSLRREREMRYLMQPEFRR